MADTPTSTPTPTPAEIAEQLQAMLAVSQASPGFAQRMTHRSVVVQFELVADGDVVPYHLWLSGVDGAVSPGARDHDDCDIVIRTDPATLHRLLEGELGGREAIISGRLDIRKAPSMPKLLVMRSLFNRYTKARRSGRVVDVAASDATTPSTG